jgi:uncharacterized protein YcbK (DUF882 family)
MNRFIQPFISTIIIAFSISACCSSPVEPPCVYKRYEKQEEEEKQEEQKQKQEKKKKKFKKEDVESSKNQLKGIEYIDGLHPLLQEKLLVLYALAKEEKIEFQLISGYRPYEKKKNPKKNASLASWHHFGAAFDINLIEYQTMEEALDHYSKDKKKWEKLGALAESLSLTWGLKWGLNEVFHFEWHPGLPDAIRKDTLTQLLDKAGDDAVNYQKVWTLFDVDRKDDES